jgi:acid phosphatase family membrane protein YuiD
MSTRPWKGTMIHTVGLAAIASGFVAQVLKIMTASIKAKRLNLLVFFDNGGMPSSHTSLVTTLTYGVGHAAGYDSAIFSIALIFGMYFVFEAAGLRQEVGNQARVLNELADEMRETHHINRSRLKELVGHTWGEVGAGFVVGLLFAWLAFR